MVIRTVLKTVTRKGLWVRVPPSPLFFGYNGGMNNSKLLLWGLVDAVGVFVYTMFVIGNLFCKLAKNRATAVSAIDN